MNMDTRQRGLLIAFEGISASGKGTQIKYLEDYLEQNGISFVTTHWNSDVDIAPLIANWKQAHQLTPLIWSTSHAIDFLKRYIEIIEPALSEGSIVIVDRYIPTALCRDMCRGVPESFIRSLYSFAPAPDIIFYLDIDVETAFQRRIKRCPTLGYYSSGCDFLFDKDKGSSWRQYGLLQQEIYMSLQQEFGFVMLNATDSESRIALAIQNELDKHPFFKHKG